MLLLEGKRAIVCLSSWKVCCMASCHVSDIIAVNGGSTTLEEDRN